MTAASTVWIDRLVRAGSVHHRVRLESDSSGVVVRETVGVDPESSDVRLGVAMPGFGNAHSHVFHRALRGRTNDNGGTFWTWREAMYDVAARLDPERYRALAAAAFSEMLACGWTAVGEFHYVHHAPSGSPYPDHEMELALVDAAEEAGIRITLLDTCYLAGGIDQPLNERQQRFGDASAERWLERWWALRERLTGRSPLVSLGAALHSVRAVPRDAMRTIIDGLPADIPVHIHLSEQPAENEQSLERYGLTPTELLSAEGVLSPRLSVVHATHLSSHDIELLAGAGVHAVFCPTTEADLGDGIGPASELVRAGARLAVGSDQNAIGDPLLELRGLEAGERLRSLTRGRFTPGELSAIASQGGYGSLGLGAPGQTGGLLDLVELNTASMRTAGSHPTQLVLSATAADVSRVVVGGSIVHDSGHNPAIASALHDALAELFEDEASCSPSGTDQRRS